MTLTPRQELFISEYLIDRNGAKAAIRAGYSKSCAKETASRLLTNANVRAAVEEKAQETAQKLEISREKVIGMLLEAAALGRAQGQPMAMIAAAREIAKICGYYAPERKAVDLSLGNRRVLDKFEAMSDDELLAIIAAQISD